jgi:DNA adenine methylase
MIPDHKYYCEVFGGGAAVLFAKPPCDLEVYNDADEGLVNFFRVCRNARNAKRLMRQLTFTPYARKEFSECSRALDRTRNSIEYARRFFTAVRQSFASTIGRGLGFSMSGRCRCSTKWYSAIRQIMNVQRRLRSVQVDHLDFKVCLERYNVWGKDGFFYLDPPYVPETRRDNKLYRHELTIEDHQWLIDWLIKKCNVHVMLSGYDSELYRSLETHGWRRKEFAAQCSVAGNTRSMRQRRIDKKRLEVVWMNYQTEAA